MLDIGFILFLQHGGCNCPLPLTATVKTITVVDVLAIHRVNVGFCSCIGGLDPEEQLISARIFPATREKPATAFTFNLLEHFRTFNLVSKTAANDYLKSLSVLTNSVLPDLVPVCSHPSFASAKA